MDSKCIYTSGLSCPNSQRLEVSENVKYTAVTSRTWKFNPNPTGLFGRSTGLAGGGGINPDIYWCFTGPFSPKPFKKWFQIKILVFLIIRNSFPSFYFVSFFHETVPKSATFSEKIFGKKSGQIPPPPGRIRVKLGVGVGIASLQKFRNTLLVLPIQFSSDFCAIETRYDANR